MPKLRWLSARGKNSTVREREPCLSGLEEFQVLEKSFVHPCFSNMTQERILPTLLSSTGQKRTKAYVCWDSWWEKCPLFLTFSPGTFFILVPGCWWLKQARKAPNPSPPVNHRKWGPWNKLQESSCVSRNQTQGLSGRSLCYVMFCAGFSGDHTPSPIQAGTKSLGSASDSTTTDDQGTFHIYKREAI